MKKFRLLTRYISKTGKIYEPHDVVEAGELPADVEEFLIQSNKMITAYEVENAAAVEEIAEREPNHEPKTIKRKPGRPRKYETREMRA